MDQIIKKMGNMWATRSLRKLSLVLGVDCFVCILLVFFDYDNEKLVDEFAENQTMYDVLLFGDTDVMVLWTFKLLCALIILVAVKAFGPLETYGLLLVKTAFWMIYFCALLLLAKVFIFQFNEENNLLREAFVVLSMIFGILETFLAGSCFAENDTLLKIKASKLVGKGKESVDSLVTDDIEQLKIKKLDDNVDDKDGIKVDELSYTKLGVLFKSYFWPKGIANKLRCLMTFIFLAAAKVTNLYSPIFIGKAVDGLAKAGASVINIDDRNLVLKFLIIYSALSLSSKVFSELQKVVYLRVGQVAYAEIAEKTFRHLHSLSLDWHLKKKLGNVLRSMDRGVQAADTVVRLLFLNLAPTIIELVAVFVIFYLKFNVPLLSASLLIGIVLYGTLTFQITIWRKKFRAKTNKHDNDFHDKATDSLINYETVKYFSNEEYEIKRYVESINDFQLNSNYTQYSLSFLNSAQNAVIQLSILSALMIATVEIFIDESLFSIGDFVTVQVYMMNVFSPLSFLGMIYSSVVQAFIDMANLSQLLAQNPDITDSPDAKPFPNSNKSLQLEFRDVSFSYPSNDLSGVRQLSFLVPGGKRLAIVGPTGAGKSTISRLIFRFYDPNSGSILVNGIDIRNITQKSLRNVIGVVPQDTVLFNDTLRYNLEYGKPGAKIEEIEAACEAAQILSFIKTLPEGFDTKVGERGLRLSGGEKQRVAIARCLLKNPPLVILDEATSALDTNTEKQVQLALDGLTDSRTTIVIAHRLSTIRDADEIMVLKEGRITERGKHVQLLNISNGLYASMWNAQQTTEDDE